MNFLPVPCQSNDFYDAKDNFYNEKISFDVNDKKSLDNLKKACLTCEKAFNKEIYDDGGMSFIHIYVKVAVALYKLYHGDEMLDAKEKYLLSVQAENPCYENFGGIDFRKYVHEHLYK